MQSPELPLHCLDSDFGWTMGVKEQQNTATLESQIIEQLPQTPDRENVTGDKGTPF